MSETATQPAASLEDAQAECGRPEAFAGEDPIVIAENVTKTFDNGVKALDDVTLYVHRGEVKVVIGPSGSGKSTFLRCLNGLEVMDGGRVVIDGVPLDSSRKHRDEIRQEVGMVFQQFNLFPHMTVLENVNLAQRLVRRKSTQEATENAMRLLDKVGISDKASSYPAQLSGGQQQRVAIARALALKPKVMLFDEATSALDPEMIGEVLQAMSALASEGMTMVVVTHEMGFAREVGDAVVFMENGRVVEECRTETFFESPSHPRTREFLSQIL